MFYFEEIMKGDFDKNKRKLSMKAFSKLARELSTYY